MPDRHLKSFVPDSDEAKAESNGTIVSQVADASAAVEHPHERKIKGENVDTSGITVKGKLADVVRLVMQAGFAVVAFSVVIIGGIWGATAIRTDYKARDAETRADHKDEITKILATFQEQQKISREDEQARDRRHEAGQERMWKRLGEVVDSQREATGAVTRAAGDLKSAADELRKIANKQ